MNKQEYREIQKDLNIKLKNLLIGITEKFEDIQNTNMGIVVNDIDIVLGVEFKPISINISTEVYEEMLDTIKQIDEINSFTELY